jgi:uncharacterized protein (TIGR04255 family)
MSRQMKNAPVYFTIAQVRFNPILSLSTFIPGIQEDFRKHNFADFKKAVAMTFAFGPVVNKETENQMPPAQPLERYVFSDTANTQNFLLEHGALSFQSTRYEVFETFVAELMKGLGLLDQMVGGLSFVERVGLRYLDAVIPREGETLGQYLIPEALGLYGRLKGRTKHTFSETMAEGAEGSLISRAIIQEGPVGFPPDLLLNELQITQPFANFNGTHAILDTDAFIAERMPFNLGEVKKRLGVLHDRINEAFRALVTPHALDIWK